MYELDDSDESEFVDKPESVPDSESSGVYTLEVLQEMRKLGLPKPSCVNDADWDSANPNLARLTLRERMALEFSKSRPTAGDKSVYSQVFPKALDVMLEVMEDPGESGKTRLAAAIYIADQFSGKASQQIEHSGSIVTEFRQAAQELEAKYRPVLEATTAPRMDPVTSLVDSFLESKVGTDFSVGKRGTSGEESEQEPGEGLPEGT